MGSFSLVWGMVVLGVKMYFTPKCSGFGGIVMCLSGNLMCFTTRGSGLVCKVHFYRTLYILLLGPIRVSRLRGITGFRFILVYSTRSFGLGLV